VTFRATPFNGGTTPAYQWIMNGSNAGTNTNSYTYVPADGDAVTCIVTSNATCVSGNPATSNPITMVVNSLPAIRNINDITVTGTQCFDASQTIVVAGNGTTFTVQNGGDATMVAGGNILYNPGTVVVEGGSLHGYISPGGPWCLPPAKSPVATGNKEFGSTREQNFFRIYPNPTSGAFTLSLNGYTPSEKIIVEIYSMKGEKIRSTGMMNEMKHDFSLAGYPAGLYMVRVDSGTRSGSSRIVKVD
jgi:hypothetical protein